MSVCVCVCVCAFAARRFGAFSTMDWAMATDVLPHPEEFAKDMGIWYCLRHCVLLPSPLRLTE